MIEQHIERCANFSRQFLDDPLKPGWKQEQDICKASQSPTVCCGYSDGCESPLLFMARSGVGIEKVLFYLNGKLPTGL